MMISVNQHTDWPYISTTPPFYTVARLFSIHSFRESQKLLRRNSVTRDCIGR